MGDHHFGNFTLGIIALLMNTAGEFVTERFSGDLHQLSVEEAISSLRNRRFIKQALVKVSP